MAVPSPQPVLSGLTREVGGMLRRHWLLAGAPAFILGAGADAVVLARHQLGASIALGILLAVLFELYVGYAEAVVAADRSGVRRPHAGRALRHGLVATPPLLGASVVGVTLPLAATGLLVLPGLWLLTRWSLFAPAIVHEHLGPRAALGRSAELVRGAYWAVAASATACVLVEHAVIHTTAHTADPLSGSLTVGLVVAAVATMAVSPPAAFTISIVYERRAHACPPGAHRHAPLPQARAPVSVGRD